MEGAPASENPPRASETLKIQASEEAENDDKLVVYYDCYTIRENEKKQKRTVTEEIYDSEPVLQDRCLEMRREILITQDERTKQYEPDGVREECMRIYSPYLLKILPDIIGYYPSYALRGYKDPSRGPRPYLSLVKPYRMLSGAREDLTKFREDLQQQIEAAKRKADDDGPSGNAAAVDSQDDVVGGPGTQASATQEQETTVQHIKLLEKELDKLSDQISMEKERHKGTPALATFDMLWLLFRPGTLVMTKIAKEWACAKVYLPVWSRDEANTISYLELKVWYLDFDGTNIRRRSHNVKIHRYDDVQPIDKLPAYPAERFGDEDELRRLRDRGKRYWALLQEASTQKTYDHYIFDTSEFESAEPLQPAEQLLALMALQNKPRRGPRKEHYRGQAMVDPVLYAKEFGQPQGIRWLEDSDIRTGSRYEEELRQFVCINPREPLEKELTDVHFQLMPQWITGFAMSTRKWMCFDVDFLKDYIPDPNIIKSLVIDEGSLELMGAVTKRRSKNTSGDNPLWYTFRADQIIGKGEGRVILLHGPPGTGKTYAAECIAEWTKRPLLRLTCGELGLDPTLLEQRLWRWFRMGEAWDAALLIDEADIYVSERSPFNGRSLERDKIVAVFLRAVEYYRGLLFLTTNAVLQLDHAVTSRISIIIRFNAFTEANRRVLVQQTMKKLSQEVGYDFMHAAREAIEVQIIKNESDIWNGREIINFALAENDEDDSVGAQKRDRRQAISIQERHVSCAMRSVIEFQLC